MGSRVEDVTETSHELWLVILHYFLIVLFWLALIVFLFRCFVLDPYSVPCFPVHMIVSDSFDDLRLQLVCK